jgi:excisionase family DNA binding protein
MNEPSPSKTLDCSTREVAEILDLAVRSVQLMVDRGELSAWKTPGGHRRISRASVDALLKRRHEGSDGKAKLDRTPSPPIPTNPTMHGSAAAPAPAMAGKDRVLLIEDSKHYQKLASMLLRNEFPELELVVADDGFSGLAMAGELQPSLLIVDILLPGMDGATLISSLRSHPQFVHVDLIVMTSLEGADLDRYMFALEGVPIVHKPRIVTDLPKCIRSLMAQRVPGTS